MRLERVAVMLGVPGATTTAVACEHLCQTENDHITRPFVDQALTGGRSESELVRPLPPSSSVHSSEKTTRLDSELVRGLGKAGLRLYISVPSAGEGGGGEGSEPVVRMMNSGC